jgi:glycosyltransferase involved in cell wall biosynthesis
MRILQLCNKPPLPKIDGGCIAIYNISSGLLKVNQDLHILTISTDKHPFLQEEYPQEFLAKTKMKGVYIDTRVNIIDAFSALVTSDSYNISRFFSSDYDRILTRILTENSYDVVHLESLFMTPYISTIRRNSTAQIVLRSHNLEHLIWERLANTAGNKAKKLYLKHLASKLKKYEKRTINEVDGIAAISFEDTERFIDLKCKVPMITIPFGIDLENYPLTKNKFNKTVTLFHLGAMNWAPNLEAVNWFLDQMWDKIADLPVKLHLGGREMPDSLRKLDSAQIKIHATVENAVDFMSQYNIMIVPLLSGSGMRVKIIEGMALGRIVITTTVGAEGIDCEDGKNILIANSPDQFYDHIKKVIEDSEFAKSISINARKLVEEKYNNTQIIQQLLDFYRQLIDGKLPF